MPYCEFCNKKCRTNADLKRHVECGRCQREPLFVCADCGYSNKDRSKYERHLARKTPCKKKSDSTEFEKNVNAKIKMFEKLLNINTEKYTHTEILKGTKPEKEPKPKEKSKEGYLYIIREREFANLDEPIYKIGKSKNITNRMKSYPKNSEIKCVAPVCDHDSLEKLLIKEFNQKFEKMSNYGTEYYRGNINDMVTELYSIIENNNESSRTTA